MFSAELWILGICSRPILRHPRCGQQENVFIVRVFVCMWIFFDGWGVLGADKF